MRVFAHVVVIAVISAIIGVTTGLVIGTAVNVVHVRDEIHEIHVLLKHPTTTTIAKAS